MTSAYVEKRKIESLCSKLMKGNISKYVLQNILWKMCLELSKGNITLHAFATFFNFLRIVDWVILLNFTAANICEFLIQVA